jgi:hypothetical protein
MKRVPKRVYLVIDSKGYAGAELSARRAKQTQQHWDDVCPSVAPHTIHSYSLVEPKPKKRRRESEARDPRLYADVGIETPKKRRRR